MDLTNWNWHNFITDDRIATLIALALNVVYAFVIIMVALVVSGWAKGRVNAIAKRYPRVDATLFGFLGNLLKYVILAMAAIFVLNRFGIQTTSLVALIGAAGLAIGLALQGTLSNLAAGVMIVMFRPFRVGDFIDAGGQMGSVVEIALFYTEMKTYDGLQIIMPNSDVWSQPIKNFSANPTRMTDLTIGVSYRSDLKKAQAVLEGIAASDPRVLAEPAPFIKVKALNDSSVDFAYRVWANRADWWSMQCEMVQRIKEEFDANGIEIPFPSRTVFHEGGEAGGDPDRAAAA
ncbi:mechanosensitive ion channel family protein [Frigidibacter sp. MR17.24]|uniref:mechanosensitive ion channel family protein n=1 Tax=Frigidibacter sp. MR17.24 TaxID=3127345 RepID=UPI0030130A63